MCCLFGIIDYGRSFSGKQKTRMLSVLARACEARGTDATGIAYHYNNKLRIYKRPLPARRMRFRVPSDVPVVMGHTRLTTQGSAKKNYNNHPWSGYVGDGDFALAHNGVLYNDDFLRNSLHLPKTRIETDSYVAVQLLEQQEALTFSSLRYMAEKVEGSFCFSVLDGKDQLWLVKGDNPLCLYHYPRLGLYLYASTEEILKNGISRMPMSLGKPERIPLEMGEILKIDQQGHREIETFHAEHLLYRQRCFYWPSSWFQPTKRESVEDAYLEDLRTVAQCCGYEGTVVDTWLQDGFTTDEIEEFLYCGEV